MTIGSSIFLIALGAILRFAVTASIGSVDLQVVGNILMIAGIVGLAIGLFLYTTARSRRTAGGVVTEEKRRIVE